MRDVLPLPPAVRSRLRPSRRRARPVGATPTLLVPPPEAVPTVVTVHSHDVAEISGDRPDTTPGRRRWIDVAGLAGGEDVAAVARAAGLGPLATADLLHVDQRPHAEVEGETATVVLRLPLGGPPFASEQITLALGPDTVLSVREGAPDCLGRVRTRLAKGGGRIRGPSGYLFYALLDAVIEMYFPLLERTGDALEALEDRILAAPDDDTMRDLHVMRRDLLALRHAVWPLREALAILLRDDVPGIDEATRPYLRDCADHVFQSIDTVEIYRETVQGLVDLHLSSISNRMNEAMAALAMIGAVFLPMTFVAGLYGMNFDRSSPYNLPELGWRYGYPYALMLMAGSAAIMVWLFRRKGWVRRGGRTQPGKAPPT